MQRVSVEQVRSRGWLAGVKTVACERAVVLAVPTFTAAADMPVR